MARNGWAEQQNLSEPGKKIPRNVFGLAGNSQQNLIKNRLSHKRWKVNTNVNLLCSGCRMQKLKKFRIFETFIKTISHLSNITKYCITLKQPSCSGDESFSPLCALKHACLVA